MKRSMCFVALSVVISIGMAQEASSQRKESKSSPQAEAQTRPGTLAQTTQSFKGTLVDASCAMSSTGTTSSTATPSGTNASDAKQQTSDNTQSRERKNEASRSTGGANPGQTCSVSSNTSQFALKLEDGRTLRFDSVGNVRAQDAIKNKKKWNEAAGAGKPIRAKVMGFMTGDKLLVTSIN